MYVNAAYLNDHLPAVIDESSPLIVTSCGNYKIRTRNAVETRRPCGRKDYQLLYIASGSAHFYINGEEKAVSAGSVIIYLPDQPQHYIYYKEDKTDVYWVHFTGSEVMKILHRYNLRTSDNIVFSGTSPDLRLIFGQIILELQLCRPMYEELLPLLLCNIFLLIGRNLLYSSRSGTAYPEISAAMGYFMENYSSEINIEDYARAHNLSLSWFIRRFKHITGQTPLQYIISLRISNAQSLLENTSSTVEEIAGSVGYDNALYFSRLFHKQTGMSPSQYRKNINQNK